MFQLEDFLCMYGRVSIPNLYHLGHEHNTFARLLTRVNKEIRAVCGPALGLRFAQPPCWLSASNYLVSGQIKYSNSPRKQTQISGGIDGQTKKEGGDKSACVPSERATKSHFRLAELQTLARWLSNQATAHISTFFALHVTGRERGGFGLVKSQLLSLPSGRDCHCHGGSRLVWHRTSKATGLCRRFLAARPRWHRGTASRPAPAEPRLPWPLGWSKNTPPWKNFPTNGTLKASLFTTLNQLGGGESNVRKKMKKNEKSLPINGEKKPTRGI